MTAAALRLGTRRSALAQAQSRQVAEALTAATGRAVELVEVTTAGDVSSAPLAQLGGTGVFVSALREALLAGRVDLAVHSLKDLPVVDQEGFEAIVLAAVPERADPRDVLVAANGGTLATLPAGAIVGTGSPRRAAQLAAARPDLQVVDVRGNVDTRIGFVADGRLDAVVLAYAGLARLGRIDEATQVLDLDVMLPAPGQGALAVECRGGEPVADLLASLDHPATRTAVTAERALLAALEAGCSAPVGALADLGQAGELVLRAAVAGVRPDLWRLSASGSPQDPAGLGRLLAMRVLEESSEHEPSEGLWGVRVQ